MALDTATLISDIRAALDAAMDKTDGAAANRQQLADDIGNAIDAFVRSGTVNVTTPITPVIGALQTTVALGAPTGPPAIQVDLSGTGAVA